MADPGTAPSTPARNTTNSSYSSSPPPRSTPATSTEKPKPIKTSSPSVAEQEPSSELEIMELDDDDDEQVEEEKEEEGTKTKKRKTPSKPVATTSKKSKTSSTSNSTSKSNSSSSSSKLSSTVSAAGSTTPVDVSNELVSFKSNKLIHKQKNGPKHDVVASYMIGRAAFIQWAVEFFKNNKGGKDEKLPEIPIQHLGAIAKDVQEAPQLLTGLAKSIRNNLASSITENMSALEDSQEEEEEEDVEVEKVESDTTTTTVGESEKEKKEKILERIDLDSIKKTIEVLANRKNYGLSLQDLKNEILPSGISSISTSLQFWVWEVQDLNYLSPELVSRFEKRRTEREEIKRSVTELFKSLSEQDQTSLLLSSKKGGGGGGGAINDSTSTNTIESSTNKKKTIKKDVKGKGKAKQDLQGEGGDDAEGEGGEEEKELKPAKGGKKKKELTEQEKLEKEEKDQKKAKEKLEKEAKKAEKAAKDAIEKEKKEQKKKEKEEKKRLEEEKKAAEELKKKKQQGIMSSFFTKAASPTPNISTSTLSNSGAGPSSSRASPGIARNSPGIISDQPGGGDFAKVFHTFTIRPGVKLAPINRFNKEEKKSESISSVEIDSDPSITLQDSISSFLEGVPKRRIPLYNPYPRPLYSVRDLVVGINDSTLTSQDTTGFYQLLKDREKVPIKVLKFNEDVRPGYVGTWSKISKVVKPRTPFEKDGAVLNYEHDSEAEWEEEPEDLNAENVDGSDGELSNDDEDQGEVSEVDSWLADDDEIQYESGYEEDGDIVMIDADQQKNRKLHRDGLQDSDDDDVIVVESEKEKKERLRKEKEKKKKLEEKQKKRKQQGPLLPLVKGPVWEDEGTSREPAFKSMKIRFLNDCSYGINPLTFVSVPPQAPQRVVAPLAAVVDSKDQIGKAQGKENIAFGTPSSSSPPTSSSTDKDSTMNKKKKKQDSTTTTGSSSSKKPFPENLLKPFLSTIQGSDKTQPVIVDEFVRKHKELANSGTGGPGLTKTACLSKWKEIGIKKVKGKMTVPQALLAQHGL
ncbi:hypothetical protein JCM3765_006378 [Sporobolomyces pararoseus]